MSAMISDYCETQASHMPTHLLDAMAETFELLHPALALLVRVVARPNGAHARRLVARVRLGRVLKVRVGPAGAVDADVAGHGDVRTPVRLAHDGDDGDLQGTSGSRGTSVGWAPRRRSGRGTLTPEV